MENILSLFVDKQEASNEEKFSKKGPFEYTKVIYEIIANRDANYKEKLDELFVGMDDNDFNFIVWILNHNLVYNRIFYEYVDMFTGLLTLFTHREYIYWYTKYMIDNEIKFPKYMQWYKLDIDNADRKFSDYFTEKYKLDSDDMKELSDYCDRICMSLKDAYINLEYVEEKF